MNDSNDREARQDIRELLVRDARIIVLPQL
jgi:hypothetical protein